MTKKDFDRFNNKCVISKNLSFNGSACIEWDGWKNQDGYGKFSYNHKYVFAHRFAYEAANGQIQDGLTIDHLCRNKICVNVLHLEAVTIKENVLRGNGLAVQNSRKSHCKHGHLLSGDNLYINTVSGYRQCKACHNRVTKLIARNKAIKKKGI